MRAARLRIPASVTRVLRDRARPLTHGPQPGKVRVARVHRACDCRPCGKSREGSWIEFCMEYTLLCLTLWVVSFKLATFSDVLTS